MNTTVEKVKLALGVSEIKKTDNGILLGSKERGIICRMSFTEEDCYHINVRTPKREVLYYPVNATVPEVIGVIHNMVKHEPGKDTELWYEKELKRSEERPASKPEREKREKPDKQDRQDRQERADKQDRADRQDRADKPDRQDRQDRADKQDRQDRQDKPSGKKTGFRRNRRRQQNQQ
ncbi:MAG: hypothetical protein IJR19_01780 [Lachnospiraceae bacterium]|nr:hypothetical protein [Lachnospiraceae bacterium]MBQ7260064.1 hypothetical protein [Lachnospiraceae bacterium]